MDKQLVARRFGRRASTYDAATAVQRHMRGQLVACLSGEPGPQDVRRVLELGCGTGGLTARLTALFPQAEIVAVDLSSAMIDIARQRCPSAQLVVADAEEYVERDRSEFDVITSNAAIQWFDDPDRTLDRCRQRLANCGAIWLATFGAATFHELRTAFAAAYRQQHLPIKEHVMSFRSADNWRGAFPEVRVHRERLVRTYVDVRTLLRTFQAAGTNFPVGRQTLSRDTLRSMEHQYRQHFPSSAGGIEVTYELLYLGLR